MIAPFIKEHGSRVLSWINSKAAFDLWSAGRFDSFPINQHSLQEYYEKEGYGAYSFFEDGELKGHFASRWIDDSTVRLAFIVVDNTQRGKGLGSKMLTEAFSFIKDMGAENVSICVFDENAGAVNCYKKLGLEYTGEYTALSLGKYKEMKKTL